MKKFYASLALGIILILMGALAIPTLAQEGEIPEPGGGDPIILPNLGSDIASLNPLIAPDGSSAAVIARLFPNFIGVDPDTLNYAPGAANSIVTGWEISEDGLTYTFTLRDDWAWSDGTPITSADVKWAFDAIASGVTDTNLTYVLDDVAAVDAPDATTVVVTLNSPSCAAMVNIAAIPVVPAHIYSVQFPNFSEMNGSDLNLTVPTSANAWEFANFRPGEQVTLIADQDFPDPFLDYVVPEGWIYKNVADQTIEWEQFLAGDITESGPPEGREQEALDLAADGYQVYQAPANTMRFIGFNNGDPDNPVNGLDEDGNPVEQGFHPVLGDARVRRALVMGMDFDAINEGAFGGYGIKLATHDLPSSWAYPDGLEPYPFDPEAAAALLDEAGWVDADGDAGTPRVCQGCLYAEEGTELSFELLTNAGNEGNESMGVLLQDQWSDLGVDLTFSPIDFNVLVETILSQNFDAVLLFWGLGFPSDPNGAVVTFSNTNDVVDSGFNMVSYYNAEFEALMDEANTVPGCDETIRTELYSQAFTILFDESPWFWATSIITVVAQPWVQNYDPRHAAFRFWNEDGFVIQPDF
jgi:peptide/nickel transport system substrate-binding protein